MMFRTVAGYIIIVVKEDFEYDCIFNNRLFDTEKKAEKAIGKAKKQDKREGEVYRYRITSLFAEP